ncbi:desmocollin 2-like protein [Symphorus nematophorus]
MAKVLIFCLVLVLYRVESCFIPSSKYIHVSGNIKAGDRITTVEVADCDTKSTQLTLNDSSFTINSKGEIDALTFVPVTTRERTFSVLAQDSNGLKREMEVHLIRSEMQENEHKGQGYLARSKREWAPPPFNIIENDVGPFPKDLEEIVSDSSAKYDVYYTFSGSGVDQHPVGVFTLDRDTGMLTVHKPVDREEFPSFTITTKVFDRKTHKETDRPLLVTIIVDDENDNAPTFTDPLHFSVPEQSKAGTIVGKVNATDRDQPNTSHVKIRYSLLSGLDRFAINPETGVITTVISTLDREVQDKYMVTVQIKDCDGAEKGLSNTGTATISLADINDNPPTFTKTPYSATIKENEKEKLILRIPVEDKDLINTPNWISKFIITKGNENGNFRVDTDPKTNEGLLYVTKPLDYEHAKNVKLEIQARNEADLQGTTAQWLSIPVDVTVTNVDEGPQFSAPTIRFPVKENAPNGSVIGSYTAVDPETKSSEGIKYFKAADPASWISVDRNTGELKVANTIDRESHFVQDGIYNITMKAVDASSKTGTGTVILVVEDENDEKPTLPSEVVLCEKEGELGSVIIVAKDNDQSPFSSPFSFGLPPNNDGKWSITRVNETAAKLQHQKELPTGIHKVKIDVRDLQGSGEVQEVKVRICQCLNGVCLDKEISKSLGPLALLAMLLPLALLLLLCLLLAFFCATKKEYKELDVGDGGGILLKSNTEAPGDEVDSSLIGVPTVVDPAVKGSVKGSELNAGWLGNKSYSTIGARSMHENGVYQPGVVAGDMQEYYSSAQYDSQYGAQQIEGGLVGSGVDFDSRYLFQESALLHTWQTNGRYLQQKLAFLGTEEDGRYADDITHAYGFEGVGSAAGSIGCCSDFGDKDDLDFLNTLGPKFKTLADVCTKT